jgi:hypothetical protein
MTEKTDEEQKVAPEELEEESPEAPAPPSTSVINPHIDGVATRVPAPPADAL